MAIRCKLQDVLWEKRLRMADLVRLTGISKTTIHSMYHDRLTKIDYGVMDKLCFALHCQPGDLLEYLSGDNSEIVNRE